MHQAECEDPLDRERVTALERVSESRSILALISSGLSALLLLGEYLGAVNFPSFGFNAKATLHMQNGNTKFQPTKPTQNRKTILQIRILARRQHSQMRIPCNSAGASWAFFEVCCTYRASLYTIITRAHINIIQGTGDALKSMISFILCYQKKHMLC
jgi:hypothetical protein